MLQKNSYWSIGRKSLPWSCCTIWLLVFFFLQNTGKQPITIVSSSLLWNSDLEICKRDAGSYLSKKIVSRFEETNQELHGDTQKSKLLVLATWFFLWDMKIKNQNWFMDFMFDQQKSVEEKCQLSPWTLKYRVNKFAGYLLSYKNQETHISRQRTELTRKTRGGNREEKTHLEINWSVEEFSVTGWSLHKGAKNIERPAREFLKGSKRRYRREMHMLLQDLQWQKEKTRLAVP